MMANSSEGPRDPRLYIRVTTDLPLNPKLAVIDSPAAGWAYTVSMCYCGGSFTDGHFPLATVLRLAGVEKDTGEALVEQGLWHLPGHDCDRCPQPKPGHAYLHDYLEHQRSAEEARDLTSKRREAGRAGAAARWGKTSRAGSTDDAAMASAMANAYATSGGRTKRSHNGGNAAKRATADTGSSRLDTQNESAGQRATKSGDDGKRMASAMANAQQDLWQNDGKPMAEERRGEESNKNYTAPTALPAERAALAVVPDPPPLTVTQRSKAVTDAYALAEPMCKWPAVNAIVIKAIKTERWSDDQIQAALIRLAADSRSVTVDSLRTELTGPPAPRTAPAKPSTTDQRVAIGMAIAAKFDNLGPRALPGGTA